MPRRRLTHAELKSVGVSEYLGADVACSECGCQLQDMVCSHCEAYLCRSCAAHHGCVEMWVDDRMRRDPHVLIHVWKEEEEDA